MTHEHQEECCQRIAELEEENEHLRRASAGFGQLAERLNVELREERRHRADPRRVTRSTPERRAPTGHRSGAGEGSPNGGS